MSVLIFCICTESSAEDQTAEAAKANTWSWAIWHGSAGSSLRWLLLPAQQRELLSKYNTVNCLKPIQTRAGQTSEGPEVLFGSDKLQKGASCVLMIIRKSCICQTGPRNLSGAPRFLMKFFFAATCSEPDAPLEGPQ